MHPRTEEVLRYLDDRRRVLWETIDAIPASRYDQAPPAGGWSIAAVVEHLGHVETAITTLLMRKIREAREAGLGPETGADPVMPTMDIARLLDRNLPIDAPEALRPQRGLDMTAAKAALERSRQTLRDGLLAADGLALSQVVAPQRYLGPLNAYQWLVFIGAHEARHTAQIRAVSAALTGG